MFDVRCSMFGMMIRRFSVSPLRRFLIGNTESFIESKKDGGGIVGLAEDRQQGVPGAAALDEVAQRLAGQQGAVGGKEQEELRIADCGLRIGILFPEFLSSRFRLRIADCRLRIGTQFVWFVWFVVLVAV